MHTFGRWVPLLGLLLLLAACTAPQEARLTTAALPALTTLTPGQSAEIQQNLSVNVVFVGFEPGTDIDEAAFLAGLPASYRPQIRFKEFYGIEGDMGLQYDYAYNLVYADQAFEDGFFGYLDSIAVDQPLTLFQQLYNTQTTRSLDVTGNQWIDAPSVEQWLADNTLSELGVDTSHYTVFFVNWYGRDDFRFHGYTKTDEPDPDTGYNFGLERESRKMTGWGGTTPDDEESGLGGLHRIWFYDLSAGPEGWSDNWNLDDADLDGNGVTEYRIPPVWEYGNLGAYRPFDDLSGDLAKVTRYVALDLLMTTSPLYNPAISGPLLPSDIQVDVNVYDFDGEPGDGTEFFDAPLIAQELNELQPHNSYEVELNSLALDSRAEKMYDCFYWDDSCYGQRLFGIAFADPFLYHLDKITQFIEGDADYEVPVFAFNASDELFTCCLGYADDNWADGTQSFVFAFDAPFIRDLGYGFTTTTIHEVGHHVGMSHPHDGYDFEADVDFGPSDDYYFAWLGNYSNTMMSYIDLNWDFSQFDRDNMGRFLTATYFQQTNHLLERIGGSKKAHQVSAMVSDADVAAATALARYQLMDYAGASMYAKAAYETLVAAAETINLKIEPQNYTADYKARGTSEKFVDVFDPNGNRFKP